MSNPMRDLRQSEESRLAIAYAEDKAAANAEAEQVLRGRITANATRLVEVKALELAETEARQLAQIRARSERTLAAQAEALAEAERKLEMAAIERRSTDLEAAREAEARAAADRAAAAAAEQRAESERQAAAAAHERAEAAKQATAAAEARRQAANDEKSALAQRRSAQWSAFWAGARWRPVAIIGMVMLLSGLGGGVWLAKRLPTATAAAGPLPELRLRLDDTLDADALRAAAPPAQKPRRGR